ncbi:hypothetical protein MFLAVUS_003162 [Mucor flavus]|uniref:RNA helicase n=1 Tax=Mucor flavus TaxID=439312 RepID=A0ABP9YSA1_9FUNG
MTSIKRKYDLDPTDPIQEPNPKKPLVSHDNQAPEIEPEIKQFSSDQRLALPEEPICVVCGKYGEYINDETDQDVCSLQCKGINTDLNSHRRLKKKKQPVEIIGHIQDYVASNIHAKLTNYQEPLSIATQSKQLITQMLQAHEVEVKGSHVPKPFSTFDQLSSVLGDTLLKNIESLGWSMATGIQRQAVTVGLAGRDIMAIAPTHSGKTAAFLIPILVHCMSLSTQDDYKRRSGPYALIMAPTREICNQIETVCKRLANGLRNIRGEPLPNQLFRLKKGSQIIIGTPGRLLDVVTHHPKLLRVWNIRMLVLDEVDAMFSLGFGTQVKQILGKFPETTIRQTFYFSATFQDKAMEGLYKRLKQPIELKVSQQADVLPETTNLVRQTILWVENKSKAKKLFSILDNPKYFVVPILIFVGSRLGSEFLTRAIKKKRTNLRVVAMHGDKSQEERSMIIKGINQNEPAWDIIVSTDILARGIDLTSVKLVINYDMTTTLDDYVHRIGRAVLKDNQMGWSITFINSEHQHLFEPFVKMLATKSIAQVTPLPSQLKRYL